MKKELKTIFNKIENFLEADQLQEATQMLFDNFLDEFMESDLITGEEVLDMMEEINIYGNVNIDDVEKIEDDKFYKCVELKDITIIFDLDDDCVSDLLAEIEFNLKKTV